MTASVTTAPPPDVASAVTVCGDMTGPVVSTTVTPKVPVAVFPRESTDVHVTVVVPRPTVLPEAGVQVTGVEAASPSSYADAVQAVGAPEGPVASTVSGPGRASTGAVVSAGAATVSVKVALVKLPPRTSSIDAVTTYSPGVAPENVTGTPAAWPQSRITRVGAVTVTAGATARRSVPGLTLQLGRPSSLVWTSQKSTTVEEPATTVVRPSMPRLELIVSALAGAIHPVSTRARTARTVATGRDRRTGRGALRARWRGATDMDGLRGGHRRRVRHCSLPAQP